MSFFIFIALSIIWSFLLGFKWICCIRTFVFSVICYKIWLIFEQVLKSAELLGYFVKPDVWCKVLLQNVRMSQTAGSVAILAAVIRGTQKSCLLPFISEITTVISDPGLCHVAEVELLLYVECCFHCFNTPLICRSRLLLQLF